MDTALFQLDIYPAVSQCALRSNLIVNIHNIWKQCWKQHYPHFICLYEIISVTEVSLSPALSCEMLSHQHSTN